MFKTKKTKKAELTSFLKTQGLDENQIAAVSDYVLQRDRALLYDYTCQSSLWIFIAGFIVLIIAKSM